MFFSWKRWVAQPKATARKTRRRPKFIPQVEQLETRLAPAVIATVNSLSDAHAASPVSSPLDAKGKTTLRSAIEYANSNNLAGTISFQPSLNGTINLTLGTLNLTDTAAGGLIRRKKVECRFSCLPRRNRPSTILLPRPG